MRSSPGSACAGKVPGAKPIIARGPSGPQTWSGATADEQRVTANRMGLHGGDQSDCLKSRLHLLYYDERNAIGRAELSGTMSRLMRFGTSEGSPCVALD
jgi:hypothetical protein